MACQSPKERINDSIMTTYHVLNGDCLAEQLRQTKINGNVIICRECLIEGNLDADNMADFWEVRAKFIAETYHVSTKEYFYKTVNELQKLGQVPDHSTVCLWFENDLFCQTNMWFIISILAGNPTLKMYRVFPIIEKESDIWKGFGMANAANLEQAYSARIKFKAADIQLGENLWNAYKHNDLETLHRLAAYQSDCFEFLEEVCKAHIERFPRGNALGRPQKAIKEIIESKSNDFEAVFSAFLDKEGVYGFGDLQVKNIYDKQKHSL